MVHRAFTVNAMLGTAKVAIANVVLACRCFLNHHPAQTVGPGDIHTLTVSDSGDELFRTWRIICPTVWRCAPHHGSKLAGDGVFRERVLPISQGELLCLE
jgi:hypothetical protein